MDAKIIRASIEGETGPEHGEYHVTVFADDGKRYEYQTPLAVAATAERVGRNQIGRSVADLSAMDWFEKISETR